MLLVPRETTVDICVFDEGCKIQLMKNNTLVYLLHDMLSGAFGGELSQLDDAGPYYNLGIRQVNKLGTYHYMCTRNNDFSNRDQKGRVTVMTSLAAIQAIGWMGGQLKTTDR